MNRQSYFRNGRKAGCDSESGSKSSGARAGTWQRIRRLFAEAIQIETAKRKDWLEAECAGDPAAANEVVSLFAHDDPADRFLEDPAWYVDTQGGSDTYEEVQSKRLLPGSIVGSWQVLREIASGGMGTVYLAERAIDEDGSSKQLAAIKVMKRRVDPELFALRFRRERRILAQLNHPFIARFLEGGALENGLPYFVLDYVEGEPIREYCTNHRLGLEAILKLFCEVCYAVAYSHRNLVVHRDLKPTNILVTADGSPRLIDFGIAKLLITEEKRLSMDETIGIGPFTPRYGSPEQIRGEQITTATDIFALGIILCELVTGTYPFGLANRGGQGSRFEFMQRICEGEPRLPLEAGPEQKIQRSRRNDLEAIIGKALQKNPVDRYKSVEHLVDDIRNFLECRPVTARPESWWYRSRRLVQRHPTSSLAICIAVIVGLCAITLVLASDRVARGERDYALEQRELATSSTRTLIGDLARDLETLSAPVEHRLELLSRAVQVFDKIDSTARSKIDPGKSPVQLLAEVETQIVLGRALEELGDTTAAVRRTEIAESQARRLLASRGSAPEAQLTLAKALLEKSRALRKSGDTTTATKTLNEALSRTRASERIGMPASLQPALEAVLCDLLVLKVQAVDVLVEPQAAIKSLSEAVAYGERAYDASPLDPSIVNSYADSLEALGSFYIDSGDASRYRQTIQKELSVRREAAERSPGDVGLQRRLENAIGCSGALLDYTDPKTAKVVLPSESLMILRRLCAADPNNVDLDEELIRELGNYGDLCADTYQYRDAVNLENEAIDRAKELFQERRTTRLIKEDIQSSAFTLSYCYAKLGDFDGAKKTVSEVLAPLTKELESADPETPDNRFRQAALYTAQGLIASQTGNLEEGRENLIAAVNLLRQNVRVRDFPQEKAFYGGVLAKYGAVLGQLGEIEEGYRCIEQALHTMCALRDSSAFGLIKHGDLTADILEAEENLHLLTEKLLTSSR